MSSDRSYDFEDSTENTARKYNPLNYEYLTPADCQELLQKSKESPIEKKEAPAGNLEYDTYSDIESFALIHGCYDYRNFPRDKKKTRREEIKERKRREFLLRPKDSDEGEESGDSE